MKQPFRILHVVGTMNRAGTETMLMNLYRQMDRSRIQFDFMIHTHKQGDYDEEILQLGGRLYRMPMYEGINHLSYCRAWRSFLADHPEHAVVHGHIGRSAAIYLRLAKARGRFTIAHSHGMKKGGGRMRRLLIPLLAYPTRSAAHYFFGCSRAAGVDRFGVKAAASDQFKVLNNAIFAERFQYSRELRYEMRGQLEVEGKFVIGHVGRFTAPKNHKRLIQIFKSMCLRQSNAVLMLVGEGELRGMIEQEVEQAGLTERVMFTGGRADIAELMQAMDVFVFPSLHEGLGIVTIEAQAAGLPCIVSDSIPAEAFITKNIQAISLDEPPDAWAEAIVQYAGGYERESTWNEIKRNGFDIADTARWLEDFYLSKAGSPQ
ncbi:glycosyltransferase family 1 protein [Paenibacillus lemnae]|uniref:Glycosyltransferase family 1 protein n=1 Tax=Paenibacillus lemnae TaxID=1330551 RepID=A0A848M7M5_PAELE|nr:glycosyltransferase family 1 protein [Paenibacillus lemnae]NMO96636.1 glycosyltransferase family 1 protein [Paenibacillus lemnae]